MGGSHLLAAHRPCLIRWTQGCVPINRLCDRIFLINAAPSQVALRRQLVPFGPSSRTMPCPARSSRISSARAKFLALRAAMRSAIWPSISSAPRPLPDAACSHSTGRCWSRPSKAPPANSSAFPCRHLVHIGCPVQPGRRFMQMRECQRRVEIVGQCRQQVGATAARARPRPSPARLSAR